MEKRYRSNAGCEGGGEVKVGLLSCSADLPLLLISSLLFCLNETNYNAPPFAIFPSSDSTLTLIVLFGDREQ